jgi:hypothetical protein
VSCRIRLNNNEKSAKGCCAVRHSPNRLVIFSRRVRTR